MGDEVFEMIVFRAPGPLPPGDDVAIERFQDLLTEKWEAGQVERFYSYSGDHHVYLREMLTAMGVNAAPLGERGETSDFFDLPNHMLPGLLADLDSFVLAMEDDPSPLIPLIEAERERGLKFFVEAADDLPPSKRPGYPGHAWMSDAEVDANWRAMQSHRAKSIERMRQGRALMAPELGQLWAVSTACAGEMRTAPPEIDALFDLLGPNNIGTAMLRSFDYIQSMRVFVERAIQSGQSILCVEY